ncbi:hypothetical protein, partial [Escherichia coli]|uniref:hypothetical protein n=1 Tax=Escherichia coli TaxID=562 RepID=UPI00215B06FC
DRDNIGFFFKYQFCARPRVLAFESLRMSNPSLQFAAIVFGLCAVPLTLLVQAEDTAAPATETPDAEAAPADSAAAEAPAEAPAAEAVA